VIFKKNSEKIGTNYPPACCSKLIIRDVLLKLWASVALAFVIDTTFSPGLHTIWPLIDTLYYCKSPQSNFLVCLTYFSFVRSEGLVCIQESCMHLLTYLPVKRNFPEGFNNIHNLTNLSIIRLYSIILDTRFAAYLRNQILFHSTLAKQVVGYISAYACIAFNAKINQQMSLSLRALLQSVLRAKSHFCSPSPVFRLSRAFSCHLHVHATCRRWSRPDRPWFVGTCRRFFRRCCRCVLWQRATSVHRH
jgi:hypothetical protein